MTWRRGVLRPGDRVRFDGCAQTVVGVSGTLVLLADEQATTMAIPLAELLPKADFEVIGATTSAAVLASMEVLARLPQGLVDEALWWERQLQEVIYGLAEAR